LINQLVNSQRETGQTLREKDIKLMEESNLLRINTIEVLI